MYTGKLKLGDKFLTPAGIEVSIKEILELDFCCVCIYENGSGRIEKSRIPLDAFKRWKKLTPDSNEET